MKVYFYSRFDCKLESENENVIMRANEIYFIENKNARFFLMPISSGELFPYQFELFNGELLSSNLTSRKINNDLIIELKPFVYYNPKNLEIKTISYNLKEIKIYLYHQPHSLIQIYFEDDIITNNFYSDFKFSHFSKKIDNTEILFIKLEFQEREFYYIFKSKEKIFEGYIKEINIKDKHLIVLLDDINCYGEKRVISINISTDEKEEYLIHYDNREVYLNLDIKYLFMDAILLSDFEKAKAYLSNDLKFLDDITLKQFFGEFDSYQLIEDVCLLEKNGELHSLIQFTIQNNIIININNID